MLTFMSNTPSDDSGTAPETPANTTGTTTAASAVDTADPREHAGDTAVDTGASATAMRKLGFDDPVGEVFADDQMRLRHAVIGIAAAAFGGAALIMAVWFVLSRMSLPAFGGSMMTRALSTAGTVGMLI